MCTTQASPLAYFSCFPKELEPNLDNMCANSEVVSALEAANSEVGKIAICIKDCNQRKAVWSWTEKTIYLDPSLFETSSNNNWIISLVFEIFNAAQTSKFIRIKEEASSAQELVDRFERLEHVSALKTKKVADDLLGDGKMHDFKYVDPDFNRHRALQEITGHSKWLSQRYFPQETYQSSLSSWGDLEKEYLYALLFYFARPDQRASFQTLLLKLQQASKMNIQCKKVLDYANFLFPS